MLKPFRHEPPSTPSNVIVSLMMAVLGAWLLDKGFPGTNIWFVSLLGLLLIFWSAKGLSFSSALVVGAVCGFTFFGILIWWLTIYLGLLPWISLTLLQVFFFSLGYGLVALVWRHASAQWQSLSGRLVMVPALVAAAWCTREAASSRYPFGGFAWGRLSQSQSEGPLADLASWFGTAGMSFVLAFLVASFVALASDRNFNLTQKLSLALAGYLALAIVPNWPVHVAGSLRVLAVQGNADAGLFAEYERGDNLRDHFAATMPAFGKKVDLVVWPENATDIDPLRNKEAAYILSKVTNEFDAPLVVGAITRSEEEIFNSILLWDADTNPDAPLLRDQYDKMHPVPFAEYLPWREFFYPLAPSLFDMVPRDYSFGTRDPVFHIGGVPVGVAICFDIVDDSILREIMAGGAQLILAPTNNADFGRTDQSVQQLSIARLRAIETGRSVVNISTVGTSSIIGPSGQDLGRLPTYSAGYLLADVPLATHRTPATIMGGTLEAAIVIFFGAGLVVAVSFTRRQAGPGMFTPA